MLGRIITIFALVGVVSFLIYGCGEGNDPLLSSSLRDDGLPPAAATWKTIPYDVENIWQDRYKVTLKWNKVTTNKDKREKHNIAGYKILKADTTGNLIATYLVETRTGGSDEFYIDTDTNLIEGKEYSYRLISFDTFLRESEASSPQLVKIQVTLSERPMPPQSFYWVPGINEVTIFWAPVTSYEDGTAIDGNLYGYELFRNSGNDTPEIPLAILDPQQTSYSDKFIENGQTYNYWIRAVDRRGAKSAFSNPISVVLTEPPKPQNETEYKNAVNVPNPPHVGTVTAVNNANGTVTWTVNWDSPSYNSDGTAYNDHQLYKVFRSDSYSGVYTMLGTSGSTSLSYVDASTTKFYYKLSAVDIYGNESDLSGAGYQNATGPSMNHTTLNFRVDNNASSDTTVVLKWNDVYASSTDCQSYYVYRAVKAEGPYYRLGSVPDDGTERIYGDTNVVQSVTYYYRITGVNTYSESEFSYYVKGIAQRAEYVFEAENGSLIPAETSPNVNNTNGSTSNVIFRAIPGADYGGGWALYYGPGNATETALTTHNFTIAMITLPAGNYDVTIYYETGQTRGNYSANLYDQAGTDNTNNYGQLGSSPITNLSILGYDAAVATPQIKNTTYTNIVLPDNEFYYLKVYYDGGGGTLEDERMLVLDKVVFTGR